LVRWYRVIFTIGDFGTATKTYNYKYEDSNWKDKLTEFGGKAITYDAICTNNFVNKDDPNGRWLYYISHKKLKN